MPELFYDIPLRELAIVFSALAVVAAVVGLVVVKPGLRILFGTGPDFNQNVSFGGSGFNLFYGLLLGLLTVAAYQNNQRVAQAIEAEASRLGSIYADLDAYPEPVRSDAKSLIRDYTLFTMHRDWQAHRTGDFLDGGAHRADVIRSTLAGFEPETPGQIILHDAVIRSLQEFSEARQQRVRGVTTEIPDVLWYAVLVGAAISVTLLAMLRMRLHQHLLLATISAFYLSVILFVIVVLDDPLRGEAGLDPGPFQQLWERQMIWDDEVG
ncbi:hypothetical protein ACKVEX_15830 [Rhodocyclaceae bacterium SMB388]